jgi:hypothetical protein
MLSLNADVELVGGLGEVSGAGRPGMLAHPLVAGLAGSDTLVDLAGHFVQGKSRPVRAIYFDKSPGGRLSRPVASGSDDRLG